MRRRNKISDLPHLKFVCGRLAAFFLLFFLDIQTYVNTYERLAMQLKRLEVASAVGLNGGWGFARLPTNDRV